jgi:hypothetical protein
MVRRALLSGLAALVLVGCSGGDTTGRSPGAALEGSPQAVFPDPGIEHVHGLGVDPADGVLYAATHFGLFALPQDGPAVRVADRYQDTMGFTVVGPRTFLGSGHPDPVADPDLPPRVGLIRSTDAGGSWQPVSLTGQADFHVLRYAHGLVYGYESTSNALLVSDDEGRTWDARSTTALRDMVVSPQDPDVLLATTAGGLRRSSDGGRSFAPIAAPGLVVLAWDASGLYGLDGDGLLHVSADGGGTWQSRGSVGGAPEALTVADGRLHAAVTGGGIVSSADGGTTWTTTYRQPDRS